MDGNLANTGAAEGANRTLATVAANRVSLKVKLVVPASFFLFNQIFCLLFLPTFYIMTVNLMAIKLTVIIKGGGNRGWKNFTTE